MEQQRLNAGFSNTKVREISLGEMLSGLFKWWWVTALCIVLVALAAYSITIYTYVPVYTSSASLVIMANEYVDEQDERFINDIELSSKLVNTYTTILTSNRVMELVAQELDLNVPAAVIRSYVTVEPVVGSEVLNVIVDHPDPELAAKICNAIMKVAPNAISETVLVGSVNVLDEAKVPELPNPPAVFRNTGAGAILGLMLGLVIVFLLLFFDNTIKSGDDVKHKLGLTLLGSIPYHRHRTRKRQGALLVTSADAGFGFVEAYKAAGTNLRFASAAAKAKKLLVTSTLAGEGKSTVSVNLAITIAQTGKSVLLLDCDLRKSNVHRLLKLGTVEGKGIASVLTGDAEPEECIVYVQEKDIYVMPNTSVVTNPSELLGSEKMAALLAMLEKKFDYIILDTPPSYLLTDAVTLSVYTDGVILVVKQGYAKLDMINLTKAAIENAGVRIIGCILNGLQYNRVGTFNNYRYDERFLGKYYKEYAVKNRRGADKKEVAVASDND
ncbi:Tyrosine-protein kinase YwqD [Sporotomaculum syntrophicum]|uniref:non-specific protein-tyrosine kinase n=1 Tax=Sporotomaculum syntrophicum TaxID=182264 RepID=A0A9D3AZQ4_9FIRM|nr:polysaccharide biosynthesis tyrosine autokinase [Sporotomaculum syntrophicum]KAF1086098.1 Tyrosine-protein kinase YwqD [Sporotomaculum syntrophicum]